MRIGSATIFDKTSTLDLADTCLCGVCRCAIALAFHGPAKWLSWSAGLYTDEGFYTLDARHWVLFRHIAPGNFHDSLLSPGLSVMQRAIFGAFGVSDLCSRSLSVVLSLATIVFVLVCAAKIFWRRIRPI